MMMMMMMMITMTYIMSREKRSMNCGSPATPGLGCIWQKEIQADYKFDAGYQSMSDNRKPVRKNNITQPNILND